MRLAVLVSLVATASAFSGDVRRLKPEEAGLVHNDVFAKLAEKYSENLPRSKTDMMMDISQILEGFCDEADTSCRNLAYEATLKQFSADVSEFKDVEYPGHFHSGLKDSFNEIGEAMRQIDHDNLDDITDTIEEITAQMRDMEDVDAAQRTVALSAASIALESTKLWHNVFVGDESHHLRKLQGISDIMDFTDAQDFGPLEFIWKVAGADAAAAMNNGINILEAIGTNTADAIFAFGPVLVISLIYFAVPASAAAFATFGLAGLAIAIPGIQESDILPLP